MKYSSRPISKLLPYYVFFFLLSSSSCLLPFSVFSRSFVHIPNFSFSSTHFKTLTIICLLIFYFLLHLFSCPSPSSHADSSTYLICLFLQLTFFTLVNNSTNLRVIMPKHVLSWITYQISDLSPKTHK